MQREILRLAFLALVLGASAASATPVATFTPLGDLTGGAFDSRAEGISADGSVIVGTGQGAAGREAFRWTDGGGMVGLGRQPGAAESHAYDVSADGSVVVGGSQQAFRWTQADGMVGLGNLPGGGGGSLGAAFGVSADGSVVVGGDGSPPEAFRWTSATGMIGLGALNPYSSEAEAVSADGSVIVGGLGQAFRWTTADGMVGMDALPGSSFTWALGLSADGSTAVGVAGFPGGGQRAALWNAQGEIVDLSGIVASDVSGDGSIVVGSGPGGATIWDAKHSLFVLQDLLRDLYDLDLPGWRLYWATAISDDGHTIAGWGFDPAGGIQAWRVTISALIPEPDTAILLAIGLGSLALRRRSAS